MLVIDVMLFVGIDDMEFDFFDGCKVICIGDWLNLMIGELVGSVFDMVSVVCNIVNILDVSFVESLWMVLFYFV